MYTDSGTARGDDGNDYILMDCNGSAYGGAGNDEFHVNVDHNNTVDLYGGSGNDLYRDIGGDATITIHEDADGGIDTVEVLLGTDYTLGANLENVVISNEVIWKADPTFFSTPSGGGSVAGNELDNHITGAQRDETFWGNGGKDTIDGGAGADTIHGGDGNDTSTAASTTRPTRSTATPATTA